MMKKVYSKTPYPKSSCSLAGRFAKWDISVIKLTLCVRPQKVFWIRTEFHVLSDGMSRDSIQGQDDRTLKLEIVPFSQSLSAPPSTV